MEGEAHAGMTPGSPIQMAVAMEEVAQGGLRGAAAQGIGIGTTAGRTSPALRKKSQPF